MATTSFTVPNWAQALMAEAVGLDPRAVVVRMEDDTRIVFLVHKTRMEYCVNKLTGNLIMT